MNKHKAYLNGQAAELKRGDTLPSGFTFAYVADDGRIATQEPGELPDLHQPEALGCTVSKFVKMIDITPQWIGVLPIMIMAIENGTPEGRKIAIEELQRMAALADKYVALDTGKNSR